MKYKYLIFDTDGTILDSLNDLLRAINAALKECGYDKYYEYEEGKSLIGSGAYEFATRAMSFTKYSKEEFDKFRELFYRNYLKMQGETTKPFDGITNLLVSLKEKGYLLFIASNKPHKMLTEIICDKFPDDLFEDWIGEIPGNKIKPDPQILNILCRKYNLNKKDCLYIGDSNVDVETCKNAKMDVALVTYGYGNYKKELLDEATYVVNSVKELEQLLS